jgi:hypothetical protein
MDNKKIIYLKDYIQGLDGNLQNKIVVGSDIRPRQAVNLAILNSPIQIVTNGFDEWKVVRIKENISQFINNPVEALITIDKTKDLGIKIDFNSDLKKSEFMSQVEEFLKNKDFRKAREDLYLIADELFTNFSKSALNNTKDMTFGIDSNDEMIVIYCKDSFGSLKPNDMLVNIQRCFNQGVLNAIKPEEGKGAGIGSYLIYSLGVGLAITVDANKGSLVCVWMPKKINHDDRLELNKCLLIIEEKES